MSGRWLERYRAGRRDQVWHELRQLGDTVHERPDVAGEARLVCDEMARRARHNVDLVVARLTAVGYRFHTNDDEQTPVPAHVPPTTAAGSQADWLVARFGAVPLTLLSWVRHVGDVWLVGTHPSWPVSASADPLVIEVEGSRYPDAPSIRGYFDDEWERHPDDGRLFVLPVAPDRLHKDNVSGGPPYGFVLPDGCVDGLFVGETTMPFVAYLNTVFRHGGFPWPTSSPEQWRARRDLAADLLPL